MKVSTIPKVDRASRLHAVKTLGYTNAPKRGDVTVNAGFKSGIPFGRVWLRVRGGGKGGFLAARGPDFSNLTGKGKPIFDIYRNIASPSATTNQWISNIIDAQTRVQAKIPLSIAKGRRSIGLSRQSIVQIADSLGIDLVRIPGRGLNALGLAKARAALATSGKAHRNGFGLQGGNDVKSYVDLINRLPYGMAIGMDRTLLRVVSGRAQYIERSYAKGAFSTQRKIIRAFPGLFTVTTFGGL